MNNRLVERLKALKSRKEKALGLFITNGFPEPSATVPILRALDTGGVDFIELGMPFSDPLAEGLPIQHSSEIALAKGVRMEHAFDVVRAFRQQSDTPLLLMGYANPVFKYGIGNFCVDARSCGVDGLIIPDLPPNEAEALHASSTANCLSLINLVAPNSSNDRVSYIDRQTTGFVYAVSVTGLTGSQIATNAVSDYLKRIRPLVKSNPLLVGFGIKNYQDIQTLAEWSDGCIVGSALIKYVELLWADSSLTESRKLERVTHFVQELKYGPTQGPQTR